MSEHDLYRRTYRQPTGALVQIAYGADYCERRLLECHSVQEGRYFAEDESVVKMAASWEAFEQKIGSIEVRP